MYESLYTWRQTKFVTHPPIVIHKDLKFTKIVQ